MRGVGICAISVFADLASIGFRNLRDALGPAERRGTQQGGGHCNRKNACQETHVDLQPPDPRTARTQ
jgi:hypothetical protein